MEIGKNQLKKKKTVDDGRRCMTLHNFLRCFQFAHK